MQQLQISIEFIYPHAAFFLVRLTNVPSFAFVVINLNTADVCFVLEQNRLFVFCVKYLKHKANTQRKQVH